MENRAGGRTHRRSINYNYQEWCLREVGSPADRERQRRGREDARQTDSESRTCSHTHAPSDRHRRRVCRTSHCGRVTCIPARPCGGPTLGSTGGAPSGSGSLSSPGTQGSIHAGQLRKFHESKYNVDKECCVKSLVQGRNVLRSAYAIKSIDLVGLRRQNDTDCTVLG